MKVKIDSELAMQRTKSDEGDDSALVDCFDELLKDVLMSQAMAG